MRCWSIGLVLFFALVDPSGSLAQRLSVVVGRQVPSEAGVFRELEPDTRFRKREIIHVDFILDAEIDSISPFGSEHFTVLEGMAQGHSINFENGERTMKEWRAYRIKAHKRGVLQVPSMTLYSAGKAYTSAPVDIVVGRR